MVEKSCLLCEHLNEKENNNSYIIKNQKKISNYDEVNKPLTINNSNKLLKFAENVTKDFKGESNKINEIESIKSQITAIAKY